MWGKTGSKLYGLKSGSDFADNHKRFAMFCHAAIQARPARSPALPSNKNHRLAF